MSSSATTPQILLNPRAAAQALAVSERTLWGLTVPRGPIRSLKIGRLVRYAVSELERWAVEQGQVGEVQTDAL